MNTVVHHPDSVYAHILGGQSLVAGQPISNVVPLKDGSAIGIGHDRGNGYGKHASILHGKLVTQEMVNAIANTTKTIAGAKATTYRLQRAGEYGLPFCIGDDALKTNTSQPLPTGSTGRRLSDVRQIEYEMAAMVAFLRKCGYPSGRHTITLSIAIPNDEIVLTNTTGRTAVIAETEKALREVYEKTWTIEETNPRGEVHEWELGFTKKRVVIPQTMGAITLYSRDMYGRSILDGTEAIAIVDIGHGDTQGSIVQLKPFSMSVERIGDGTIRIAKALLPAMRQQAMNDGSIDATQINMNQAQAIAQTKTVIKRGKTVRIEGLVDEVTTREAASLAVELARFFRATNGEPIIVGGGSKNQLIRETIEKQTKSLWGDGQGVFFFDPKLTSVANAIGAFMQLFWVAQAATKAQA